jgi:hypothetical protein
MNGVTLSAIDRLSTDATTNSVDGAVLTRKVMAHKSKIFAFDSYSTKCIKKIDDNAGLRTRFMGRMFSRVLRDIESGRKTISKTANGDARRTTIQIREATSLDGTQLQWRNQIL